MYVNRISHKIIKQFSGCLMIIFAFLVISCDENQSNEPLVAVLNGEILKTTNSAEISYDTIQVRTSGDWNLIISYKDLENYGWCSADISNGSGNGQVILTLNQNDETSRQLEVLVRNRSNEAIIDITQKGFGRDSLAGSWLESPTIGSQSNSVVITHFTSIGNKPDARSYTALYDTINYLAYYVAYPLYPACLGSTGRSPSFTPDPALSANLQPNYSNSFANPMGYDRGHQLPSADRTNTTAANAQTFYYTNVTIQNSRLNQGLWANLESMLRAKVSTADTLYIVTGAVLQTVGGSEMILNFTDRDGKAVQRPNYFYKVVLRLKDGQYDAIGFWYENRDYAPQTQPSAAECKSVHEIEQLTGFKFFLNLPPSIYDVIDKQKNPSAWGL